MVAKQMYQPYKGRVEVVVMDPPTLPLTWGQSVMVEKRCLRPLQLAVESTDLLLQIFRDHLWLHLF